MDKETFLKIFEIQNKVLFDKKYEAMSKRFHDALDSLQIISETFSQEQWEALEEYIRASAEVNEAAIAIALSERLTGDQ